MANTNGDLNVDIGARLNKFEAGLKEVQKDFKSLNRSLTTESRSSSNAVQSTWGNSLTAIGGYMAAAFSVQAITRFASEAVNLAAKAEGVEAAFKRLNDATLLDELRKATRGTVSDVELMRQAVRAQNFQVPLSKLATFFEFATKRAAQTGESVDYLVNSIIDGIGRKSTLVMDNLGISAARLQEEVKKVGDFGLAAGNIIAEELEKAGDVAVTSAQKIGKLAASYENLKTVVGERLLAGEGGFLDNFSRFLDVLARSVEVGELLTSQGMAAYDKAFKESSQRIQREAENLVQKYGSIEKAQEAILDQSTRYRVEANKALETDEIRGNKLLGMSEAYAEASKQLEGWINGTKKSTEATEQSTESILAQADAIIEARRQFRDRVQTTARFESPEFNGFDIAFDTSDKRAESTSALLKMLGDDAARASEEFRRASLVASTFGVALNQAFTEGMQSGANFGEALKKMFEDLAKQMAAALLTALALKAAFSLIPGLGTGMSFKQLFLGQIGLGGLISAGQSGGLNLTGQSRQQGSTIINTLNTSRQNVNRWNDNSAG